MGFSGFEGVELDGIPEMETVNESQAPGVVESTPSVGPSIMVSEASWGQLHSEILNAWIDDEDEWGGDSMEALAKRLRSSSDEFAMILEDVPKDVLAKKRLERLLELESIRNKDGSWDKLENIVIRKLLHAVESRQVPKTSELLAIASVANKANRRVSNTNQGLGGNGGTVINVHGASSGELSLPGAGGLGVMRLTLSPKSVEHLSKGITIDASAEKFSDSVEMLGTPDVPELSKMADRFGESDE
jgi:hypothetical protein